jgi:two-component system, OmpR family, sensor kinase
MTGGGRSLTGQLLVRLILAQTAIYLAAILVWMMFSPYATYEDLAAESARQVVLEAVRPDATGRLAVAQTAELADYAAARPGFSYAVMTTGGQILPGSAPALAAALAKLDPFVPRGGRLDLDSAGVTGRVRFVTDAERGLTVITAGNRFRLEDTPAFFSFYAPAVIPITVPALIGVVFVVPFVVRRALRRLRAAGAAAGAIDLRSLDRRLPADGIPREVAPFVETINGLLDRLEDGIRHQRRFTANAAHELRTPVAILRARVDGMADGPVRQALLRDCQRLAVLVDQLLSAARLEQREVAVDEDVDLIALLRDLVADCAPMAIRSGRTIEFLCGVERATVRGNAGALRSAAANLIDNALRAEPERGLVEVVLTTGKGIGTARIEVVDHGQGIAPADATLIFEPFWRKDEHKPGTGLGLSIVREIARLHDGQVWTQATPGGGATFVLDLPAKDLLPGRAAIALLDARGDRA